MTTQQLQKLIEDAKSLSASIDRTLDNIRYPDLTKDQQNLIDDLYFYADMILDDVQYYAAESRI